MKAGILGVDWEKAYDLVKRTGVMENSGSDRLSDTLHQVAENYVLGHPFNNP